MAHFDPKTGPHPFGAMVVRSATLWYAVYSHAGSFWGDFYHIFLVFGLYLAILGSLGGLLAVRIELLVPFLAIFDHFYPLFDPI